MPIVLAFSCALVYGVADYCGGRAARTQPSAVVTLLGQAVSLVLVVGAVLVVGTPVAAGAEWLWGGLAGAAGAVGLVSFYYALGNGAMTVVAPTTAVIGAVLPVVAGLVQGERPHPVALVGIVAAVVCVALVSGAVGSPADSPAGSPGRAGRRPPTTRPVFVAACVAGLGFGALFVLLGQTDSASGLWPLVAARCVSVPLLAIVVVSTGVRASPDRRILRFAVAAGVLDMMANVLYLAAVRGGLLSLVAVVSSLYPASTVGLAFAVDGEQVSRWQATGLALAAVALTLVTLGRN